MSIDNGDGEVRSSSDTPPSTPSDYTAKLYYLVKVWYQNLDKRDENLEKVRFYVSHLTTDIMFSPFDGIDTTLNLALKVEPNVSVDLQLVKALLEAVGRVDFRKTSAEPPQSHCIYTLFRYVKLREEILEIVKLLTNLSNKQYNVYSDDGKALFETSSSIYEDFDVESGDGTFCPVLRLAAGKGLLKEVFAIFRESKYFTLIDDELREAQEAKDTNRIKKAQLLLFDAAGGDMQDMSDMPFPDVATCLGQLDEEDQRRFRIVPVPKNKDYSTSPLE